MACWGGVPGTRHSWLQGVREHFRNQTRVITLGSWVNLCPLSPPLLLLPIAPMWRAIFENLPTNRSPADSFPLVLSDEHHRCYWGSNDHCDTIAIIVRNRTFLRLICLSLLLEIQQNAWTRLFKVPTKMKLKFNLDCPSLLLYLYSSSLCSIKSLASELT